MHDTKLEEPFVAVRVLLFQNQLLVCNPLTLQEDMMPWRHYVTLRELRAAGMVRQSGLAVCSKTEGVY